ncbi:Gfo/Idh/MocA family oxidoreductase [Bombilactobacillus folatiphilus]|uniref:Gfo/Idh/MocA family oxidoreductase n=1 Tax=Bombilactobacillus folatiphilus TaxID=2923362 RepID=A0ABY4P835_9LACO|nr:Gfo/Idh/MocA family oxidoreductase [Bombilactobacillus folatiphilus]UQS81772.1 Gfo/Idh/MocA family oxidoreductase [Bombilactobacillus folatiphilus]
MLKLGVIGTNWITRQFVEAAATSDSFQLTTIYSRTKSHAQQLAQQLNLTNVNLVTKRVDLFANSDVDVVYVASPNSHHYEDTMQALAAGKHVIVEKPLVSTRAEFLALQQALKEHPSRYVLEAARHIHEAEFQILQQKVQQLPQITGATLTYRKYSSRYDQVLAGEEPNVFSPQFSGGALYDLGVYLLYDAVCLFGMPMSAQYFPQMIATQVDGQGTLILHYQNFDVTLLVGKISNSYLPSEIYSNQQTLLFDDGGTVRKIWDNQTSHVQQFNEHNPMLAEAKAFSHIIQNHDQAEFERLWYLADQVNQLLTDVRQQAQIKFSADQK